MTAASSIHSLESYHLLGRSGLRVPPLCLGTKTFGAEPTSPGIQAKVSGGCRVIAEGSWYR